MKKKKLIYPLVLLMAMLVTGSCSEEHLDINTDPNFPSSATSNFLLPSAEVQYVFAFAGVLDRITSTLSKQIVNTRYHRWQIGRTAIGNSWRFDIFAGALQDLETIINQETEAENWAFVGVAKLQKAYIFAVMTDLFGDLPFTEYGKEKFPDYDDDEMVYTKVLALIDDGLADLNKPLREDSFTPGTEDYIYGGDTDKWIKMGNSLKLRMYVQSRKVTESESRTNINQLIASGNLILESNDDFKLKFGTSNTPENRHPNFVSDYPKNGRENYMSVDFDTLLTRLDDPRLPYYFENQGPAFEGRVPGVDATSGNDDQTRTLFGIYPVGGRFGGSGPADGSSGNGDAPYRMITSYMVYFMIAEAELTLNNDMTASQAAFQLAIEHAFDEVNAISGAPDISSADISDYVDAQLAKFERAADDNERLDIIITQKYVAQFGNGIESFSDFRRTGFPSYPDIDAIQDPLGEGVFPRRLPYDLDEFQGPNPPDEDVLLQTPVFWDVN